MQVELVEKNAAFTVDKKGVMIVTDIERKGNAVIGELIYDGKNVAILNRNNRDFYTLRNIAPVIREKIKQAKYVTIIEKDESNIYSYQVEVSLKDDLGFKDTFDEYAQTVMSELKEKLSPEDFEEFLKESEKFVQDV